MVQSAANAVADEEIIPLSRVAEECNLAPRTVYDAGWRRRAGLFVVKMGGRIVGVRRSDYVAALRRGF